MPASRICWIVTACGACTRFGIARADGRLGERVELGARLLKGELHRAGTLHPVGRDKGFGDTAPDDEQAVIAQYHDVLVAEIGKEALAFLEASPGARVVVVGNIADHL